ncbi:Uncharacterized mitochondrial protein AtMg00310 [Linum perenne]
MLGKQGWKFLSQPDALVTKVFKARYFPKWDFLSAPLGNGPSYVWQSIRKSQEVVRRGSRWRLGNGERVRVWGEQWLRDDENLEVITVPNIQLEGLRVCDLILPGTLDWDVQKLYNLFEERDCREIVNIPLGMDGLIDRRIWHYDPKGNYTVRSAYRVLMDKVTPHEELRVQGLVETLGCSSATKDEDPPLAPGSGGVAKQSSTVKSACASARSMWGL